VTDFNLDAVWEHLLNNPKGSRWRNFSLDKVRAGKIAERSRVFSERKNLGNSARIFCLSPVICPEPKAKVCKTGQKSE